MTEGPTTSPAHAFVAAGVSGIIVGGLLLASQSSAYDPNPGMAVLAMVLLGVAWAFLLAGLVGLAVRGRPVDEAAPDPTYGVNDAEERKSA